MYERKVCYLDYFERNVKVRNVGFAKLNLHDDRFSLEIQITGLGASESFQAWIELEGMDGILTPIRIENGRGSFRGDYDAEHIGENDTSIFELGGLKIPLPGERMIRTEFSFREQENRRENGSEKTYEQESWKEKEQKEVRENMSSFLERAQKVMSHPVTEEIDSDIVDYKADNVLDESEDEISNEEVSDVSGSETNDQINNINVISAYSTEDVTTNITASDKIESIRQQSMDEQASVIDQVQRRQGKRSAGKAASETKKANKNALEEHICADKWEQLCRTYQQIHPFNGRTYIRLTPKDFVILRKEYQQLVNNSFLLHGFYNYRHLILGRENAEEGEIYYLGVPGTYYDREKMVAVMFGFEGFEASEVSEVTENIRAAEITRWRGGQSTGSGSSERQYQEIRPGTFGYYMKRVEI